MGGSAARDRPYLAWRGRPLHDRAHRRVAPDPPPHANGPAGPDRPRDGGGLRGPRGTVRDDRRAVGIYPDDLALGLGRRTHRREPASRGLGPAQLGLTGWTAWG